MAIQPLYKLTVIMLLGLSTLCFSHLATASTQPSKQASTQQMQITGTIPDLRNERDVKTKKRKFFKALRPMVEAENKRIGAQRQLLLTLKQKNEFSEKEQQQIDALIKNYRFEKAGNPIPWDQLLKRVDTVPLELVLSQAANESAWGTSRFAREANNLFGQWCFSKGCGIVPSRRNAGAIHEVAAFKSPQASVRSYLRNINTGRVYQKLRNIRAKKRTTGEIATAVQLAEGLSKYSERGQAYVKEIKSMIAYNGKYMRGEM